MMRNLYTINYNALQPSHKLVWPVHEYVVVVTRVVDAKFE